MNTTVSLFQLALILGMAMREVERLARTRRIPVHHVTNKVKYFDAAQVLNYIRSLQS